jgi:hypothetical protein
MKFVGSFFSGLCWAFGAYLGERTIKAIEERRRRRRDRVVRECAGGCGLSIEVPDDGSPETTGKVDVRCGACRKKDGT